MSFVDTVSPVLWRAVPDVKLHWTQWGDEYVVYNTGSGDTHVLDPVSALLVQQITESSGSTAELCRRVAILLTLEATGEFQESLEQTLRRLDALGLIESVSR